MAIGKRIFGSPFLYGLYTCTGHSNMLSSSGKYSVVDAVPVSNHVFLDMFGASLQICYRVALKLSGCTTGQY